MRADELSLKGIVLLSTLAMAMLLTAAPAAAQAEKLLHGFRSTGADGTQPRAALVFDSSGNLYGTTSAGGIAGVGTVFELSPRTAGGWSEKILHSFTNGKDGNTPYAGLIIDASGNLYGTTLEGGFQGLGSVFELSPKSGGGWTEKVIYSFHESNDGIFPRAGLTMDAAGNLYGTTSESTSADVGTVFELSPTSSGTWTEKILFSFSGANGSTPEGGVVFDAAGNLYSTTEEGGAYGYGAVFELSPSSSGWSETVLYSFNNNGVDPLYPFAGLAIDSAGNLYGTAVDGAAFGGGAVFELSPSGGTWSESIVHAFNYNDNFDGINPEASPTVDSAGNLYGTTNLGGNCSVTFGCGTVYKLSPSSGSWTETILHNFGSSSIDGQQPEASVILDVSGNVYGTTKVGGAYGDGTAFEIKSKP